MLFFNLIPNRRLIVNFRNKLVLKTQWTRNFTLTRLPEIEDMKSSVPIKSHSELYRFSLNHPEKFWGALARSRITWMKPFEKTMDCNMESGKLKWFIGGRLNVSVNCVDRHYTRNPDKIALVWEKNEPNQHEFVTYGRLYSDMNKIANTLKKRGIKKGDRVAIFMPPSPLAVASFLACARIGAIHTVIFAGFSAEALAARINGARAKIIITTDVMTRAQADIDLYSTVQEALSKCPSVKHVLVNQKFKPHNVIDGTKCLCLTEEMESADSECPPEEMDSCDPLFMLYTSGSIGKPKGLIHGQAGYLLYSSFTQKHVFDYHDGEIFGCVTDIGWITGHSYIVYGTLCNGGTSLLFESSPTYPNPGRFWEMVQRLKLTHFYTDPTVIRLLLKHGNNWVKKYDRSSLRVLASVGEALSSEAWNWYHDVVGDERKIVLDTWLQTETGGVCIAPRPSARGTKIIRGKPMRPMYGVDPVIINEGRLITHPNIKGSLCLRRPTPGLAQTIYGNHNTFVETYFKRFPGRFCTGDAAILDDEDNFQIVGRLDDVLIVRGNRLGTAEVEDALNQHPAIAESAVVGICDETKEERIFAFVVLKKQTVKKEENLKTELKESVEKTIASYAVPDYIQICTKLPKTRSKKIMRWILKVIVKGKKKELGDVSTLAEPEVVNEIIKEFENMRKTSF